MYNNTFQQQQYGWTSQPFSAPLHYEIIKVNGEAGAHSFRMAPNSSAFLADTTNPERIWIVQTDGAGYLTVTPLDAHIHQEAPPPDYNDLAARVKQLEEKYEQFNTRSNKQPKPKQQSNTSEPTN